MALRDHFTEHPASVGETYTEHFRVAAGFAGSCAVAAVAAANHAVIPTKCEKTARARVWAMYAMMNSGARGEKRAEQAQNQGEKRPVVAA